MKAIINKDQCNWLWIWMTICSVVVNNLAIKIKKATSWVVMTIYLEAMNNQNNLHLNKVALTLWEVEVMINSKLNLKIIMETVDLILWIAIIINNKISNNLNNKMLLTSWVEEETINNKSNRNLRNLYSLNNRNKMHSILWAVEIISNLNNQNKKMIY